MDSILVTGGAGFIGSNLVRRALATTAGPRRRPRQPHLRRQRREPRRLADRDRASCSCAATSPTASGSTRCSASTARAPCSTSPPRRTSTARSTTRARSCAPTSTGTFELLEAARRYLAAPVDAGAVRARRSGAPRSASSTSRPTRCSARSAPTGSSARTRRTRRARPTPRPRPRPTTWRAPGTTPSGCRRSSPTARTTTARTSSRRS